MAAQGIQPVASVGEEVAAVASSWVGEVSEQQQGALREASGAEEPAVATGVEESSVGALGYPSERHSAAAEVAQLEEVTEAEESLPV